MISRRYLTPANFIQTLITGGVLTGLIDIGDGRLAAYWLISALIATAIMTAVETVQTYGGEE